MIELLVTQKGGIHPSPINQYQNMKKTQWTKYDKPYESHKLEEKTSNHRHDFNTRSNRRLHNRLQHRTKSYLIDYINEFRSAYKQTKEQYPFKTEAICILPDHIHLLMQLPENDDNYAIRIAHLKTQLKRQLPKECRQFNKIDKISRIRYLEKTILETLNS